MRRLKPWDLPLLSQLGNGRARLGVWAIACCPNCHPHCLDCQAVDGGAWLEPRPWPEILWPKEQSQPSGRMQQEFTIFQVPNWTERNQLNWHCKHFGDVPLELQLTNLWDSRTWVPSLALILLLLLMPGLISYMWSGSVSERYRYRMCFVEVIFSVNEEKMFVLPSSMFSSALGYHTGLGAELHLDSV